jgi:hypothetical protein
VRQYRYGFHGDIVKYFASIDVQTLRSLLARHIAFVPVQTVIVPDSPLGSAGGYCGE